MRMFSLAVVAIALLTNQPALAAFDLQISEFWAGQSGPDLSEDWFELTNVGNMPWVSGTDPVLHYDDDSFDAGRAADITGLIDIQPGESVIVMVNSNSGSDITDFRDAWQPDIDLTNVEVGTTGTTTIFNDGNEPGGLGSGGDGVVVWLGDPNSGGIVADLEIFPAVPSGVSYDEFLGAISTVGNASGAVQTTAMAGNDGDESAIGSPGSIVPEPSAATLALIAAYGILSFRRKR